MSQRVLVRLCLIEIMQELPKNFPEYSIMYKTLSKQIKTLKQKKEKIDGIEIKEINLKIQKYELEIMRIKKLFPEDFFEEMN